MPDVVEVMKRRRGQPKVDNPKQRVSLRLDPKIIAAYKATGESWQSRINDILARELPVEGKTAAIKGSLKRRGNAPLTPIITLAAAFPEHRAMAG